MDISITIKNDKTSNFMYVEITLHRCKLFVRWWLNTNMEENRLLASSTCDLVLNLDYIYFKRDLPALQIPPTTV